VCSKFCSNKEDLEEVVQDTFVTLFKTSDELRSDTFMGYLRKIATRKCYLKHRQNARREEFTTEMDLEEQSESYLEVDKNFLPEAYLQDKEMQSELMRIIEKLPKNQREMIYLYYYVDINTEEIAKLLDCRAGNIRQALYMARQTIKSKLEGTFSEDKKKALKGIALIPLADALLLEEQAFVASYASTAGAGVTSAETVAKLDTVSKISKTYMAVACAVVVCVACVTLYFAVQQENYEQNVAMTQAGTVDSENYEQGYEIYDVEIDNEYERQTSDINEEYIPQISNLDGVYEPQTSDTNNAYEFQTPENAQEPEIPVLVQDDIETNHTADTADEPEPVHIDRTAEILAALAAANTRSDVNRIINYFGFTVTDQMRLLSERMLRFYVANEGSGDILIGMSEYEDGSQWQMRFEHFRNATMPTDIIELIRFMD